MVAPQKQMEMLLLSGQAVCEMPMIEDAEGPADGAAAAPRDDRCFLTTRPDEAGIIFDQLSDALKPHVAVALISTSATLWNHRPQVLLKKLRQDHNALLLAAAALAPKTGMSYSQLRHARTTVLWHALSTADMRTLGALSKLLAELEVARINYEDRAGVGQLAVGLGLAGAAALPRLLILRLRCGIGPGVQMGGTGASALAYALLKGAMPELKELGESPPSMPSSNHLSIARTSTRD